jgi:serine/threonine-protein kinase
MAVVLWECFAGRRLFRGEEAVDILQEVMSAPIPTLQQIGAQIPAELDDVIARALSRDLETRYATALDFAQAVERAAGPEHSGTPADVARLMEAIFGARMALRQEQVRATIGSSDLDDLLREAGLPARDRVTLADVPTGQLLAELAPPAPTGRYAMGTDLRAGLGKLRTRRALWWPVAGAAVGIAVGALVTLALMTGRPRQGPVIVRGTVATATPLAAAPASTRKVVLPLPFFASRVVFDDTTRDLDPATDVVALDVPNDADVRHRVTIVALDGTRAEGTVLEQDGIARPDGDGYAFIGPPGGAIPEQHSIPGRTGRPLGTVHNGFTKLR